MYIYTFLSDTERRSIFEKPKLGLWVTALAQSATLFTIPHISCVRSHFLPERHTFHFCSVASSFGHFDQAPISIQFRHTYVDTCLRAKFKKMGIKKCDEKG